MFAARPAKKVQDRRRILRRLDTAWLLAIEHPERIPLHAAAAIKAQRIFSRFEKFEESGAVRGSAITASQGVQLEQSAFETDAGEVIFQENEQLGIDQRIAPAQRL